MSAILNQHIEKMIMVCEIGVWKRQGEDYDIIVEDYDKRNLYKSPLNLSNVIR